MNRRLKIFLSAYACEPGRGSEPEVGWRWATSLACLHEVTVVTRANNEEPLRRALAGWDKPQPNFLFYDLPQGILWLKRAGMPVALYYLLWQIGVRWRMRRGLDCFDIIHHITFNSFRQPGFWWFCTKPVVLGPLGGGQICPWAFFPLMRGRRISEALRSVSVILSPLLPHLWLCFAGAKLILAANRDTEARIQGMFQRKVVRLLETGIPEEKISKHPICPRGAEVRLLWLGWFIQIKAPELALRAFARAHGSFPSLRLTMAGEGPLAPHLKKLARELGIAEAVEWPGRVPHAQVPALLESHNIFMFTSLRDTSGNVLLEAMAEGLPSVTLLHQGAEEIATDETSIRVRPVDIEQTVEALSEAILRLANSGDLRTAMGMAARKRITEVFAWKRQAERLSSLYADIVPSK